MSYLHWKYFFLHAHKYELIINIKDYDWVLEGLILDCLRSEFELST